VVIPFHGKVSELEVATGPPWFYQDFSAISRRVVVWPDAALWRRTCWTAEAPGNPRFLVGSFQKRAREAFAPSGRLPMQHRGSYSGSIDHDDHGEAVFMERMLARGPQHQRPDVVEVSHSGSCTGEKGPFILQSLQNRNDA